MRELGFVLVHEVSEILKLTSFLGPANGLVAPPPTGSVSILATQPPLYEQHPCEFYRPTRT